MIDRTKTRIPLALTIAFTVTTISFSLDMIDFNHVKNLVLILVLLIISIGLLIRPLTQFVLPYPIAIAVPVILLSTFIHAPGEHFVPGLTLGAMSHYLLLLLFMLCFMNFVARDDQPRTATRLLIASAVAVSILAWIQYLDLLPTLFPAFPKYGQPVYSVFGNQNLLGGFIAIAIPLVVRQIATSQTRKSSDVAVLLLLVAACLITGSRSAWLAATIGTLCTIPYRSLNRRHGIVAAVALTVIVTVTVLNPDATTSRLSQSFSQDDAGFHTRIRIWTGAMLIPKDELLIGIGPGMFQYRSSELLGEALHAPGGLRLNSNHLQTLQAHSTPLDLIIEFGLAGLAGFIFWTVLLVKGRTKPAWGSAVALTLYISINTITQSTPHLLAVLLLAVCLWDPPSRILHLEPPRSRMLCALAMISAVLVAGTLFAVSTARPSYQLAQARDAYSQSQDSANIRAQYKHAADNPWAFPQTHLEYGILLLDHSPELAKTELSIALRGMDTGEVHLALGQANEALGDHAAAAQSFISAVYRWPRHFGGWNQLLRNQVPLDRAQTLSEAQQFLSEEQFLKLTDLHPSP